MRVNGIICAIVLLCVREYLVKELRLKNDPNKVDTFQGAPNCENKSIAAVLTSLSVPVKWVEIFIKTKPKKAINSQESPRAHCDSARISRIST